MRNGIEVERVVSNRKIVEPLLLMAQILRNRSESRSFLKCETDTTFRLFEKRDTVL